MDKDCQTAFDELKDHLTSAPAILPILDTDASNTSIGGVLSQLQDDDMEHAIAYASRVLTRPERRYCVTRWELLSVVTFTHHFQPYILGGKFTIRTDHGSLIRLSNFKEP